VKTFTVDDPVYKTEPLFVGDCTHAELAGYLRRRFHVEIETSEDCEGTVLTFQQSPWRVLWVRRTTELPTLLHELFHLVTAICQERQIPIVAHLPNGENGDEAAAYLFEFFARECLRRWKR